MTEQTVADVIAEPTAQGVQAANTASLEKTGQLEAGLQNPVKIEGVADKNHNPFNERVDPAKPVTAPVAAPIQQIAPVSADGEKTSSRESMKSDAPAEIVQVIPGPSDVSNQSDNPPVGPGSNSEPETTPEIEVEPEVAFEDMPPMKQAENLLFQIPGRQRFY
jgi:hypothetical protein